MIYFIEALGAGVLKIGYTDQEPEQRLRQLQTGCPHTLRILLAIEGSMTAERATHALFAHLRDSGEWFRIDEELRAYIWFLRWAQMRINSIESSLENLADEVRSQGIKISSIRADQPIKKPDTSPVYTNGITDAVRRAVLDEFQSAYEMETFLASDRGR